VQLSKEQVVFIEECMKWSKYKIDNYDYTSGNIHDIKMYEYGNKRRQGMAEMIGTIHNAFKEARNNE